MVAARVSTHAAKGPGAMETSLPVPFLAVRPCFGRLPQASLHPGLSARSGWPHPMAGRRTRGLLSFPCWTITAHRASSKADPPLRSTAYGPRPPNRSHRHYLVEAFVIGLDTRPGLGGFRTGSQGGTGCCKVSAVVSARPVPDAIPIPSATRCNRKVQGCGAAGSRSDPSPRGTASSSGVRWRRQPRCEGDEP